MECVHVHAVWSAVQIDRSVEGEGVDEGLMSPTITLTRTMLPHSANHSPADATAHHPHTDRTEW